MRNPEVVPQTRQGPGEQSAAAPRGRRSRLKRWYKLPIGVGAFIPAGLVAFRFLTGRLGANPIAEAMNQLGLWTLILLLASLACTPLKLVFGWNWPLQVRRLLGLCAFAYLCM